MSKTSLFANMDQDGIKTIANGEYRIVSTQDVIAVSDSLRAFSQEGGAHGVLIHDPASVALNEEMQALYDRIKQQDDGKFVRYRISGANANTVERRLCSLLSEKLGFDAENELPHFRGDLQKQIERLSRTFSDAREYTAALCLHDGALKSPKWHLDKHLPPDCVRSVRNILATGPQFALNDRFQQAVNGKSFDVDEAVQIDEGQSIFKPMANGGVVHRSPPASHPEEKRWSVIVTVAVPRAA